MEPLTDVLQDDGHDLLEGVPYNVIVDREGEVRGILDDHLDVFHALRQGLVFHGKEIGRLAPEEREVMVVEGTGWLPRVRRGVRGKRGGSLPGLHVLLGMKQRRTKS